MDDGVGIPFFWTVSTVLRAAEHLGHLLPCAFVP